MPITPAFSVSQSGLTPNIITVDDDSTGSDGAISARRIYFQTTYGTYLVTTGTVTDYIVWAYADSEESFDVLTEDYALSITVQWVNSGGTVLYTLTQVYCFPQYNKNFFYYLVQNQALTPTILQDNNYSSNMAVYWTNIIGAINAVEVGADIAASQNCLNRATNMMLNQNIYF